MAQVDEPDPRSVEALERLARSASVPRWQRWASLFGPPVPDDLPPGSVPPVRPVSPRPLPRQVRFLAAGLAVAILVAVMAVARRPESFDERMPVTSATVAEPVAAAVDGPASGATPSAAAVSAPDDLVPGAPVLVHVAGAVDAPGVVELPGGSRVVDAVRAAGGLRPDADPDRLNLAAVIDDGHRIVVPVKGEPVPEELPLTGGGSGPDGATGVDAVVDLNAATAEQLETLPGVGPATAAAILAHRDANGPFRSVESLIDVRGIGEAKLEAVRDLVTVG